MFLAAQIISFVICYTVPDVVTSPASVDEGWMTLPWIPPGPDPDSEGDLTELDFTTGPPPPATGDSSSDPTSVVIPALVVAVTLLVNCWYTGLHHLAEKALEPSPHGSKNSKKKEHIIVGLRADIDSGSSSSNC